MLRPVSGRLCQVDCAKKALLSNLCQQAVFIGSIFCFLSFFLMYATVICDFHESHPFNINSLRIGYNYPFFKANSLEKR